MKQDDSVNPAQDAVLASAAGGISNSGEGLASTTDAGDASADTGADSGMSSGEVIGLSVGGGAVIGTPIGVVAGNLSAGTPRTVEPFDEGAPLPPKETGVLLEEDM